MKYPADTRVLAWRLDEDPSQLLALCREQGIPCEDLTVLPPKRQREKAAERLLLRHALGRPTILSHTPQGAPMIDGDSMNISITHTQRLVALTLNERQVIGLDAETVDRQQVVRVRDKFLNAGEQQFIAADDQEMLVVAWTVKEAVIKAERNSAIDWTNAIHINPFTLKRGGLVETAIDACCDARHYRLSTRCVEGHYMTLAVAAPCPLSTAGQ